MKILESQSAALTNPEVLTHLQHLASRRTNPTTTIHTPNPPPVLKSPNYETIVKELTDYLSAPHPSSTVPLPPATYHALLTRLKAYNLAKAEVVMLVNLRPRELGLLDCVVEECDERFSEEQQEGILRVVREVLGGLESGVVEG